MDKVIDELIEEAGKMEVKNEFDVEYRDRLEKIVLNNGTEE